MQTPKRARLSVVCVGLAASLLAFLFGGCDDAIIAVPEISPGSGTYSEELDVTISCATEGVEIYFTTDGSEVTPETAERYVPGVTTIEVAQSTLILAKAYSAGSESESAVADIRLQVSAPTASVSAGVYNEDQDINLLCETPATQIFYTKDGNPPSELSTAYNGSPVAVDRTMTLRLLAVRDGWEDSEVREFAYTFQALSPTIAPAQDNYADPQEVTMQTQTDAARIYYTTDGSDPSSSQARSEYLGSSFTVDTTTEVRAVAVRDGWTDSSVAEVVYGIGSFVPHADLEWEPVAGGVKITTYHGDGGDLDLPPTIAGERTVELGRSTFENDSDLTAVTIPMTVTTVEEDAFRGCPALSRIAVGPGVTTIGEAAFASCPLLDTIEVDARNEAFVARDGVLYTADGSLLVQYPPAKTDSTFTVPDGVVRIAGGAFGDAESLTTVVVPAGVEEIGPYAFVNCSSLEAAYLPDTITTIGEAAFYQCKALALTELPAALETIGTSAFSGCDAIDTLVFPAAVESVGTRAFSDCASLAEVTLNSGLREIGPLAFERSPQLTRIDLPASVTEIGAGAFDLCPLLEAIDVEAGSTAYSGIDGVLYSADAGALIRYPPAASRTAYTVDDSTTRVERGAFADCTNLESIDLPDGLEFVGREAFSSCTALQSVTIPPSVTTIWQEAWAGCTSLSAVTVEADEPPDTPSTFWATGTLPWNAFENNAAGRTIAVPADSVDAYQSAEGWNSYASSIVAMSN